MPTCKLCGAEVDKLCKSHIIPSATTDVLSPEVLRLYHFQPTPGRPLSKPHFGGIYDRFACEVCEQVWFRDADNDAQAFLSQLRALETERTIVVDHRQHGLIVMDHVGDVAAVHRFALLTVLRCALSERRDFLCPDLQHLVQPLKQLLGSTTPTIESNWHVTLQYVIDPLANHVRTPIFADGPYPLVFLQLPHMYFLVAVSERGHPDHQAPVRLRPGSTVRVSHLAKFADWYSEILRSKIAPGLDYWRKREEAKKP